MPMPETQETLHWTILKTLRSRQTVKMLYVPFKPRELKPAVAKEKRGFR